MAVLDHPHILRLLDVGELAEPLDTPGGDRLPAGCPYLVLELARGGDLSAWVSQARPWAEIRGVLLALLDALGHAHARGVLHLDLKPANVLWCAAGDLRPGVKLGDFGIAHLWAGPDARGGSSGTPAYMAPEQASDAARRLGPWTDLHAVGLVAWALIHGELPPAARPDAPSRGRRDLAGPPQIAVPEDVYPWLERLLHVDPEGRYRRAADAAYALGQTGASPLVTPGAAAGRPAPSAPTMALTSGTTWSLVAEGAEDEPSPAGAPAQVQPWVDLGRAAPQGDAPPIPRQGLSPAASLRLPLRGIGAALFGLALPPLVGREAEQARLWEALLATASEGRARVVVVRGPAGFGKSRLLQWLAERSHEVGATEVLRALHGPEGGLQDGVWSMAARALRLSASHDVADDELPRALQGLPGLSAADVPTVVRLLGGEVGDAAGPSRPAERHRLLSALLAGLCAGRVGLVTLDDVQWGQEALELVDFVLRRQDTAPTPLLFALSVQEEALATRPVEAALLDALVARPDVLTLEVGPLRVADWPRLVDAFLTLEPALAATILEGTQGNPLFTAQLLDDWMARGLLVPTAAGYAAVGQAPLRVPEDLSRFWADRVRAALDDRSPGEREAVALAAVLGVEVDPTEWAAACARAGCDASLDLVTLLLARGLARAGAGGIGQGWAFAHGLLRQALLREAEATGRLAWLHARCAEGLEALPAGGRWIRVGRHYLAAGAPERALEPLGQGLGLAINHLAIAEAREVLALLERALDEAGVPEVDLRRWTFRLLRTTVDRRDIHSRARLEPEMLALEAMARSQGWIREVVAVMRDRVVLLHDVGRFHDAEPVAIEALALIRAAEQEPSVTLANIQGSLAMVWLQLQRHAEAERAYRATSEIYEAKGEHFLAGAARGGLTEVLLQQGRLDEADRMAALAHAHAERSGSAHARAEADALWGEVRRKQGDLAEAEALFRRAIQGFQALASSRECVPMVNLSLVLLAQGRMAEARATAERVLALSRAPGTGWLEVHAHLHLLVPCALAQDTAAIELHLARAEVLCARDPPADVDLARWTTEVVTLLESARDPERAQRVARLAARLWRALGREAEAVVNTL